MARERCFSPGILWKLLPGPHRNGILINQHESPFYEGTLRKCARPTNGSVGFSPVSRVYQAHIPTYPSGHWLFGFASKGLDPLEDHRRQVGASAHSHATIIPTLHKGAFYLPNYVKEFLADE